MSYIRQYKIRLTVQKTVFFYFESHNIWTIWTVQKISVWRRNFLKVVSIWRNYKLTEILSNGISSQWSIVEERRVFTNKLINFKKKCQPHPIVPRAAHPAPQEPHLQVISQFDSFFRRLNLFSTLLIFFSTLLIFFDFANFFS